MDETANLQLPYILASQAQKHVTHNEALQVLDALVQLAIVDRDLSEPPGVPAEGTRYIVKAPATGAWAGHIDHIAYRRDGAWQFVVPKAGWLAWVVDEAILVYWDGDAWSPLAGSLSALQNLSLIGLGTTADATNPFSAKLNKALWTAKTAAEGGDGDLRYTLNKEAAADVLSLLLQTNFSGRAEIGLIGNDDVTLKVSPDGATWKEALHVDRASAAVSFPSGAAHAATGAALAMLAPCPPGDIFRLDTSRVTTPRTYTVSTVSGDQLTLSAASVSQIFSTYMRGLSAVRIWNTSKVPAQSAWVIYDVSTTVAQVSNAAHIATWTNGETIRLGDPNPTGTNTLGMIAVDISGYIQTNFGVQFRQKGLLAATVVTGVGGDVSMGLSGSGAGNTAYSNYSQTNGTGNGGSSTVFTPVLSPISNTNLLFVRETLGAGSALSTCFVRLIGVYV